MIDTERILLDYLKAIPPTVTIGGEERNSITFLTGNGSRIYPDINTPPSYNPTQGGAVLFGIQGGNVGQAQSEGAIIEVEFQFLSIARSDREAREVNRALHDAFDEDVFWSVSAPQIHSLVIDQPGSLLPREQGDYPSVLSSGRVWFRP